MASYLVAHFCRFMDAYSDGRLRTRRIRIEDITLGAPESEEHAAAIYCIANDLEPDEWATRLLAEWRELRAVEPPPTPSNVIRGDN